MKLKSFGCSFIFGSDLHDEDGSYDFGKCSQHTWPALLAKNLGYQYECHARPGAGNLQILQRLLDEVCVEEPALFVINWTWIDRFSYIDPLHCHDRNPLGWQTIMPSDDDSSADFYYRKMHSELRDKLTSLIFVKNAIDTLSQRNLPFIMTAMDDLMFDRQWHTTPGISFMQDQIHPYISNFSGQNFLGWSKQQGFEISSTSHPLEDAHRAAADLVISDLDCWIKN